MKDPPHVQIFATDLDIEALEFARKARYPEEIADQMSPDRLKKYFKKAGPNYRSSRSYSGDVCFFATQLDQRPAVFAPGFDFMPELC